MRLLFVILFMVFVSSNSWAQDNSTWNIEFHGGAPINIPLPLTIEQKGFEKIHFTAQYYSEPFKAPIFWVLRVSKWRNKKAWEFEMKHQKLYLKNKPEEVEYFNITHGHNQLTLNRAIQFNWIKDAPFVFRTGIGVVLAHAESKIRGKEFDQGQSFLDLGYYVTGPTVNAALAKQLNLNQRFYLDLETKINLSYAKVPIVEGHAVAWHSAVEFIMGLGYRFTKRDK